MYIIDKEGKQLKVSDLQAAIEQANTFRQYGPKKNANAFVKKQRAYWEDVYQKLINLKS